MPTPDKTGGPAFPNVPSDPDYTKWDEGMTLRDYLAAKCPMTISEFVVVYGFADLKALFTQPEPHWTLFLKLFAEYRYEYADAMISFREDTNSLSTGGTP